MSTQELFSVVKLTMKALKDATGLDPKGQRPILNRAGSELGHVVSKTMSSKDLDGVVGELAKAWNANGLGEMNVVSKSPLTLEVRNCFDCLGFRYGAGVTLCSFKEGFMKAVIDDRLGTDSKVTETQCCGNTEENCRFEVAV